MKSILRSPAIIRNPFISFSGNRPKNESLNAIGDDEGGMYTPIILYFFYKIIISMQTDSNISLIIVRWGIKSGEKFMSELLREILA